MLDLAGAVIAVIPVSKNQCKCLEYCTRMCEFSHNFVGSGCCYVDGNAETQLE